jgi:uncharacterized protein (TIGR00296 family)
VTFSLTDEEGKYLVQLAKNAISAYLKSKKMPAVPPDASSNLREKCGVFVTLNTAKGHELRGCIGFPMPDLPLIEATMRAAIESATGDPRFHPVSPKEFEQDLVVEVSVLTPPQYIEVGDVKEYPKNIKVGTDGLIVERGIYRGLLLPQVAVEWEWNEEEFLSQCCLKAGLTPDAWLVEGTRVLKFQSIIFQEKNPNGEVVRRSL